MLKWRTVMVTDIKVFEKYMNTMRLTSEKTRDITERVVGVFLLLDKWDMELDFTGE